MERVNTVGLLADRMDGAFIGLIGEMFAEISRERRRGMYTVYNVGALKRAYEMLLANYKDGEWAK